MSHIGYQQNWNNKLSNRFYTTIRAHGRIVVGQIVDVQLEGFTQHNAKCIDRRRMKVKDLNQWVTLLDAGLDVKEFKQLLKRFYRKAFNDDMVIYWYLFENLGK